MYHVYLVLEAYLLVFDNVCEPLIVEKEHNQESQPYAFDFRLLSGFDDYRAVQVYCCRRCFQAGLYTIHRIGYNPTICYWTREENRDQRRKQSIPYIV